MTQVDRNEIIHCHDSRALASTQEILSSALSRSRNRLISVRVSLKNLFKNYSSHCHEYQQDIKRLTKHSELSIMKWISFRSQIEVTSYVLLKEPKEFDARSVREQKRHELENQLVLDEGRCRVHYHRKLMQSVFSFQEIIRECSYSSTLGRIISLRSYCCKLEEELFPPVMQLQLSIFANYLDVDNFNFRCL